jgi:hypothetical protein
MRIFPKIELEFRIVDFYGGRKTGEPKEKPGRDTICQKITSDDKVIGIIRKKTSWLLILPSLSVSLCNGKKIIFVFENAKCCKERHTSLVQLAGTEAVSRDQVLQMAHTKIIQYFI